MEPKSFMKRLLYKNEFVVCKMVQFTDGGKVFFTAGMNFGNSHFAQRFIVSGDKWVVKYDEHFFHDSRTKMIPGEISEELLKHLQEHYSTA